jgi:hypothetical protein
MELSVVISSRYGLNPNTAARVAVHVCFVFVLAGILISPNIAIAQEIPSWWGSSAWFDWSDYRFTMGARVLLGKLSSGNVVKGSTEYNLLGPLGVTTELQTFPGFWGIFYVDRLGIRFNAESHNFRGRSDDPTDQRISGLETDFSCVGVDLDLIRYPFFKFGIGTDYQFNPVVYRDRSDPITAGFGEIPYQSREPWILGIYGQAIPARFRDVPIIAHARFRFPMPFMSSNMAKITEWEIGAGVRPAIWETSMFGHATFSFGIEAGYRSINLDMKAVAVDQFFTSNELELKARWEGAFFQVQASF